MHNEVVSQLLSNDEGVVVLDKLCLPRLICIFSCAKQISVEATLLNFE